MYCCAGGVGAAVEPDPEPEPESDPHDAENAMPAAAATIAMIFVNFIIIFFYS